MWHKHSGTKSPAAAAKSDSSRPAGCSPTSPAATPTAPWAPACANTPDPVLIVDDFAMREHTATQSDDLYELVSDRANRRNR